MKKIHAFILALFVTASVFAQVPSKMSYQAVIRNNSNQLIVNQAIGIRISILQGSTSGTEVYTETQTPTTNANGLVTIEIGGGTGFNLIDWSSGSYFIKTETDPTGGTNYTITNTSQLLTVPYALHAKTAESVSGGVTETDPIFAAWNKSTGINITASQVSDFQTNVINNSAVITNTAKISYPSADAIKLAGIAAGAEVNVNADWNATSGDARILNKPTIVTADGSETKITAGSNVIVTGTGTSINPYVINSSSTGGSGFAHYIGELYGGGIIVSVWKVDGTEHGLIASLTDIGTLEAWSNVSALIGTSAQSPTNGQLNTNAIITQSGHTTSAAKLCDNYSNGGYSDWYLPAVWELNQCYNVAYIINTILGPTNGFQFDYYWSSTESFDNYAGFVYFDYGSTYFDYKSSAYRVRAVRKF